MDINNKKILVLAPHTDDGEFGCGGTIHRLNESGCFIKYIAFSDCQESVPEGFPKDILGQEMLSATKVLEIDISNVELLDFKVRRFNERRQDILDKLISIKNEYQPDIVFTPCKNDVHQDHQTVTNEAIRAFKNFTIFGYELPWNLFELPSKCFIELSELNIEKKIQAISKYQSQTARLYSSPDYIKALALTRGHRINKKFAEAFEVIKLIL